jgi:tRNA-specific adenosine deaminase 3
MFNHASVPNVTYTKDYDTDSIRYALAKDVRPGDELCIFYGSDADERYFGKTATVERDDDNWGGLGCLEVSDDADGLSTSAGQEDEWIKSEDLPWFKVTNEIAPEDKVLTTSAFYLLCPRFADTD